MPYKWLKFFILWIPTITIGLWEYVRHTILLSYVSMDLGNILAPILVFLITLTLLRGLFAKLENTQEALQRERVMKASFEHREQLARELHDGISQSLFLLSVKLDRLEQAGSVEDARQTAEQIRGTFKHVYEDVRQSIANLQSAAVPTDSAWMDTLLALSEEMRNASGIQVTINWPLPESQLTNKEQVELLAIIREALMNIRKHANATTATISCSEAVLAGKKTFRCLIKDNGSGAVEGTLEAKGRYGIKMMRARAEQMGWELTIISRARLGTEVEIIGGRSK